MMAVRGCGLWMGECSLTRTALLRLTTEYEGRCFWQLALRNCCYIYIYIALFVHKSSSRIFELNALSMPSHQFYLHFTRILGLFGFYSNTFFENRWLGIFYTCPYYINCLVRMSSVISCFIPIICLISCWFYRCSSPIMTVSLRYSTFSSSSNNEQFRILSDYDITDCNIVKRTTLQTRKTISLVDIDD